MREPRPFSAGRLLLGALAAIGGHLLAAAAAWIAGRVVEPSSGGGFEDIAAVVGVLMLAEIIVFIAALVASIVLFVRGRRDLATGVVVGWIAGMIAWAVLIAAAG
jgi:hypothetical protein